MRAGLWGDPKHRQHAPEMPAGQGYESVLIDITQGGGEGDQQDAVGVWPPKRGNAIPARVAPAPTLTGAVPACAWFDAIMISHAIMISCALVILDVLP